MYILWSAALLGACYVIQSGRHLVHYLDRHLGFPLIWVIARTWWTCRMWHKFAPFFQHFVFFFPTWKGKTHFSSKMACPSPSYDVISRNHSNRVSPILCKNVFKEYARSYWKGEGVNDNSSWKIQEKPHTRNLMPLPPPLVRPRVKLTRPVNLLQSKPHNTPFPPHSPLENTLLPAKDGFIFEGLRFILLVTVGIYGRNQ